MVLLERLQEPERQQQQQQPLVQSAWVRTQSLPPWQVAPELPQ
jgi:hypothetical protein